MVLSLPRWFAHRGGGSLAPENTLAGIRLAAHLGYRAVEFDVMLSADATPVLIHDETLARTTNGTGRVCDTPDRQLFALDAGDGERIPTLDEALRLCAELHLLANVEIKPADGYERQTAEIVARRCARSVPEAGGFAVLLSSFSRLALEVARDCAPSVPRGMLFEVVPADWRARLRTLGAVTLHCSVACLDPLRLAEARAASIPVLCYTVNRPDEAKKLLAAGVSGMFTDALDLFVDETTAYNPLHFSG